MKVPTIGAEIGKENTIENTKNYTAPVTEWVIGKAVSLNNGSAKVFIISIIKLPVGSGGGQV